MRIASLLAITLLLIPSARSTMSKASGHESTRIDWISPYFVLTHQHSKSADQGHAAIEAILHNATNTLHREPPTVLHDAALSPDLNSRSYVSWAPYWWPDCCQEGNTGERLILSEPSAPEQDELCEGGNEEFVGSKDYPSRQDTDQSAQKVVQLSAKDQSAAQVAMSRSALQTNQTDNCYPPGYESDPTVIYRQCVYVRRDGVGNPDVLLLPCSKSWVNMTSSVLSDALAYGFTRKEMYAKKAVVFLRAYFLDEETGVLPNINYGQIVRGPPGGGVKGQNDWSKGTFRGLIEWRHMVHVVNALVILRACGSKAWTTSDAEQMAKWASEYLHWLETSEIALQSRDNVNNMSSFYYAQLVSLYILLGKPEEAARQANRYFTGPFMNLVNDKGDQPLESGRTRILHYLNFGLEAIIVNAKLADSLGLNMWSAESGNGTTIQDAADYVLAAANKIVKEGGFAAEKDDFADLSPHIAAVLAAYGDHSDNRYQKYLSNDALTADSHNQRTWRLYNLPCAFYSSPSKGNTVSSQVFE